MLHVHTSTIWASGWLLPCRQSFFRCLAHFHIADDKPRPNQILRVQGRSGQEVIIRDHLANCWEDLLLHLEFEGPESAQTMIEDISSHCRGEVEQACREVLLKWLSGSPPSKCTPVTWRTLIGVVKKLDCLTLADELEKELLP